MSYSFLDASGTTKTAESSIVNGTDIRQIIAIGSVLTPVPVTFSGSPSISGAVTIVGTPQASLVGGSVGVTQLGGWAVSVVGGPLNINSILGTYPEDSGHTDGNAGHFFLGVRNDAVSSFSSATVDYTPIGVDSAGRILTKPFAANEALVQGVSSTVNTNPSSLLGLSGTGLRNYLTDIWVANTGSVATLVSFRDSDASIIGRTIAPATSGSNLHLATPMRTGALNSHVEFTAATATSILYVSGYGYKAP